MQSISRNHKHLSKIAQKGFTLVELLIVVIILAILAAIVVPQFASTTNDARDSAADSTLAGMRAAIDLYYQQHGNNYPGALTAVPVAACTGTAGNGVATGGAGATAADAFMEQLSLYTDVNGGTCSIGDDTVFRFGPYLKKQDVPSEPYTAVSLLDVVAVGDLNMVATADPGPGGFLFDSQTGKIIINLRAQETR